MRRAVWFVPALVLVVATSGCGLTRLLSRGKKEEAKPPERPEVADRGALGLPKPLAERLKNETLEDLASDTARTREGLRLVARASKTDYTMDEPVVLDVRVENRSGLSGDEKDKPRDVAVYFEPFAKTRKGRTAEWLFKFHVRSEADDRLVYRSPDFTVEEDARADYYHFVNLPQHAYVGRRFAFPPANVRRWLKPGQYTFVAAYEVSKDFPYVIINRHLTAKQVQLLGSKLAYARLWTGKLYSNPVTIRIRRKRRSWWPF